MEFGSSFTSSDPWKFILMSKLRGVHTHFQEGELPPMLPGLKLRNWSHVLSHGSSTARQFFLVLADLGIETV